MLADEQPRADLGVRQSVAGQARDLSFLGGEFIAGLDGAFADTLAGGQQLALGARSERLDPHRVEHLERGAQLLAGVQAPALAPQPLAVEEVGAGRCTRRRLAQPFDRLVVEAVGVVAVAEQCAARASVPSAQSVPAARVVSTTRSSAPLAS